MKLYITKADPCFENDNLSSKELDPLQKGCHYDVEKNMWYTFRSLYSIIKEVGDIIVSPPGGEIKYTMKSKNKDDWLVVIYNTYVE